MLDSALGFGPVAESYDKVRPNYPDSTVSAILDAVPGFGDILDLAAGTGKLTASLVGHGRKVWAVEPVPEMRERLEIAVPEAHVRTGTAESIPLPDSSIAIVSVAQAFQWFSAEQAIDEIFRVLKPGGVLAIVYNSPEVQRDDAELWFQTAAVLRQYVRGPRSSTPQIASIEVIFSSDDRWSKLSGGAVTAVQEVTPGEFVALSGSSSYIANLSEDDRSACLQEFGRLSQAWFFKRGHIRVHWRNDLLLYRRLG